MGAQGGDIGGRGRVVRAVAFGISRNRKRYRICVAEHPGARVMQLHIA
jgi:hypothetical protein